MSLHPRDVHAALSPSTRRRTLLLVDPQSIFRRTVAVVARDLNLADVREASSHEAAIRLLDAVRFDGLLLDIGDGITGFGIAQTVRLGSTPSDAAMPIVLMAGAEGCDANTVSFFKPLAVQRIMLKPFKVKTVLEVISALATHDPAA